MGFKARKKVTLSFWAAQFNFNNEGKNRWMVVLYDKDLDPAVDCHDWSYSFRPADWRAMGGVMPPRKGHVEVTMRVDEMD